MFNHLHHIKAIITGTHATSKTNIKQGMLKAIPWINHIAIGMLVNLTMNLLSVEGLTNNARIMFRDIVYKNGFKHDEMPIVMVGFLKLSG